MERFRNDRYFREAMRAQEERKPEDRAPESEVVLNAAQEKMLAAELETIQMDDFVDVYGLSQIEEDKKVVANLQRIFERREERDPEAVESKRLAQILEAIVIEQVELNNWLGENVSTRQTSPFDDYNNGIDFVAEFQQEDTERYLGFAVDVTFGSKATIRSKMERIRSQIHRGELGTIKYFTNADERVHGRLRFVPRVVLALPRETVHEIARLWVGGEQHALSEHTLRVDLVREIITQLRSQLHYVQALERAQKLDPGRAQVLTRTLGQQLETMERLLPEPDVEQKIPVNPSAVLVRSVARNIFNEENVHRIEELEEKLRAKKSRRNKKTTRF